MPARQLFTQAAAFITAIPLQDPCRYAYLQPVNIAADGSPVLNMTPEQELADEYRNVSITITVSESQVEKTLTGIEVTAQPAKTEYQVGEAFDPAGMEVTAVYSNGETEGAGGRRGRTCLHAGSSLPKRESRQ